ncbi:DUF4179 domain-containing protein [Paenibacillus sp. MER 180]|uniref:DUF4179 domain-containing protein n=1 Tax=unclassified Paenibacillus TaxID=185978 RepID=UPI0008066D08|nr:MULTISPECIES: DUF4179 domain-containing protein [unclassified Paenibacillus]MCM3293188.1 DUF4179 domain-containing protein [Paenibacillus sp. MER 180]OBY76972.1 Tat pathway signal protein [Paenibacillus sp. KS1]
MGHMQRTEYAEMDGIEQMIRQSSPPPIRTDKIMDRIEQMEWTSSLPFHRKPSILKRTLFAASAAVILGVGMVGVGYVSPTMAEALKKVPVIGLLFYEASEDAVQKAIERGIISTPNVSDTHDGITLKVTEVLFDGTRLSFRIEREGKDLPQYLASPYVEGFSNEERVALYNKFYETNKSMAESFGTPDEKQERGYIRSPEVLINGEPIKSSGQLSSYMMDDKPMYMLEFRHVATLPDEFELTVRTKVTQVKETYELKIPVKVENRAMILKPNATKSDGKFSYTVKQLDISPVSTRIVLDSKGPVPASAEQTGDYHASRMYYEIVDDQGRVLRPSKLIYTPVLPTTEYHLNDWYAPAGMKSKSITIKPYNFTISNKDFKIKRTNKEDFGDRTYWKNLEMTIQIPQSK